MEKNYLKLDINECLLRNGHGPCQDTCINTWGSYKCTCDGLPGTRINYNQHTCEDAGECANNNGGCSHTCLTTMGRVFCLCPSGFILSDDWKTCQGNILDYWVLFFTWILRFYYYYYSCISYSYLFDVCTSFCLHY